MLLSILPCGPIQANCYFLCDEATNNCIVIDPGDAEPVLKYASEQHYTIKKVVLTHGHFDHCMGVSGIIDSVQPEVWINRLDSEFIDGSLDYFSAMQCELTPFSPTNYIEDKSVITMDSIQLEAIHTPGHSKGSMSFVDRNHKFVFSGDTLFFESIGRTDLHGGSMRDLAHSLFETLYSLPDSFTVFPGHGPKTTISHEKANNPLNRFKDHAWLD